MDTANYHGTDYLPYTSYRYDAFGSLTFGQPQYNNVYSYNAESYNPNVDAQYLRARYYSVGMGNFLTEDGFLGRLEEPLSLNRYNYVASSPLNYKDPSGHDWKDWLPWNWGKDKKKEDKNKKQIAPKETIKETKAEIVIEIETAESKSEAVVCTTKEYDYYFNKYGTNVEALITKKQLIEIFNDSSGFSDNDVYVFNAVLKENQINTIARMQFFFAEAIVETAAGESLHEKYDKKYNSAEEAFRSRDNHKYNNIEQYFNNSSDPMIKQQVNDGAKYRGAGYFHLTWKDNYYRFSQSIGDEEIWRKGYSYVEEDYSISSAGWYWKANKLNNYSSIEEVSRKINGGDNGLEARKDAYEKVKEIIK